MTQVVRIRPVGLYFRVFAKDGRQRSSEADGVERLRSPHVKRDAIFSEGLCHAHPVSKSVRSGIGAGSPCDLSVNTHRSQIALGGIVVPGDIVSTQERHVRLKLLSHSRSD